MLQAFIKQLCFKPIVMSYESKPGEGGEGSRGEMHLLPEPLYSIPTDNTFITAITGTDQGRIFMAGKDGALYELIYQVNCLQMFLISCDLYC